MHKLTVARVKRVADRLVHSLVYKSTLQVFLVGVQIGGVLINDGRELSEDTPSF